MSAHPDDTLDPARPGSPDDAAALPDTEEHRPAGAETLEPLADGPARVAVISDVHGNLPALEAVLEDIAAVAVDETWCLGDLVGYGAQPNECVTAAAEACDLCLVGNHDLVVLDRIDIAAFSPGAAEAARWTRNVLGREAGEWLSSLEPEDTARAIGLYHASPRDPVWEYVLSPLLAEACMEQMDARVGAVGHSHVALFFERADGGDTTGDAAEAGQQADLGRGDWIINPGAVGQPRDGDPRAAWLLLELDRWHATWRRVEYEIDVAAEAIREAGLPGSLADRLYYGQ